MTASPGADAPLAGVRVLEFGHVAAGPFAGMLLADLGADVVKVEPPTGDHMRRWPPFAGEGTDDEFSLNFASVNRNKRSVVADLKDPNDLRRVRSLATHADVIVENYRPGVLARLGLGFDEVSQNHPAGIVYCSLTGYGQSGPYRDRGAFDVVIQAESGLMSVTGEPGRDPVKCGVPVGDFVAGLYAALSIVSALKARPAGGSQHIDCAMLSSLLAISALQTSHYWGTGQPPGPLGSAHPRNAPYRAFHASDVQFAVAAGTDQLWHRVARVVGREDLLEDERFTTQRARALHQDLLDKELGAVFGTRPARSWLRELQEVGVPCGPVNTYADILQDPHVAALGLVQQLGLPDGTTTGTVRYPAFFSHAQLPVPNRAPGLGEGSESVYEEWL